MVEYVDFVIRVHLTEMNILPETCSAFFSQEIMETWGVGRESFLFKFVFYIECLAALTKCLL